MTKLISQNENGVIYVESENGIIFGIVSAAKVIDFDGIHFQEDTLTVLENAGFELEQDFDNESTFIDFIQTNGETSRVVFKHNDVSIVEL